MNTLYLYGGIAFMALASGGLLGAWAARKMTEDSAFVEMDIEGGHGFEPVKGARGYEGKLTSLLKAYGGRREKRKALKNGYVRWHIIGSTFSGPKYVSPERENGGNIPELRHDGERYLFPHDASVPSAEEGVPVVVHRKGEAEPVHLPDSWGESLDAKTLDEYLHLRVTSQSPEESGGLPGLGMLSGLTPMEILQYGILVLVVVFVALEVM